VSPGPNKTAAPHPRYAQYKMRSTKNDQESRRSKFLEVQKGRRFDFMNHVRRLTDGDWTDHKVSDGEEEEEGEDMDVDLTKALPGRFYKDQLMQSEWLVEVPDDFDSEWMAVLCPVARRCLVVASRNQTRAFTKSGYCINSFPSLMPGGSRKSDKRDATILDCLYSETERTYYILDLMCWNGHTIYESETEFRSYWLHEKLQEYSFLGEQSKVNPYKFVPLPSFRCKQEDIAAAVNGAQFEIDGLLFFHKRTHYTFGSTPLVVWLKPYMLGEILGITVNEGQMGHRPSDYTTYGDHVEKWKEHGRKVQEKRKNLPPRHARGPGRGRGRGRGGHNHHGNGEMEVSSADTSTSDIVSSGSASDVAGADTSGMTLSDMSGLGDGVSDVSGKPSCEKLETDVSIDDMTSGSGLDPAGGGDAELHQGLDTRAKT